MTGNEETLDNVPAEEEQRSFWQTRVVGDYNYGTLCTPRLNPWAKDQKPLPRYGKDARLSLLLTVFLGFQHSLAVLAGTVLPGILLGQLDPDNKAGPYLVSYALITSGICTTVQILHTKIYKTKYYLGSGMLCVIATSFAFLPTAQQTIRIGLREGKTYDEAYGSLLGVFMLGAVFQSGFSFIPPHYLRRIFPTWLAGLGVFLIGVNLLGVGVQQWGGGGECLGSGEGCGVGDSDLKYGSSEYLGLGFLVVVLIIFFELFGSPFMRSCGIAFALLIGYIVASVTTDRDGKSYTNNDAINEAPGIVFLWTKTFPIGFYAPALLPTLIGYVVSTIETYGDTTATAAYSGLKPQTKAFDEAIQGGLLGDSVNSLISALSLVLPSTTASPNIGVISLTKVSARDAGYGCAAWMFIYGVFGKVGAFFTSIPLPVLGGMSTFLFANIAVSGLQVMTSHGVDRRSRFIMTVAFCFGLGGIIIPQFFGSGNFLDCTSIDDPGLRGVCDAVEITLSTGYAIGCLVAVVLNGILPEEIDDEFEDEEAEEIIKKELEDQSDSDVVENGGVSEEAEA